MYSDASTGSSFVPFIFLEKKGLLFAPKLDYRSGQIFVQGYNIKQDVA
jgi:hypothetical protein